jgi:glycosyltransferase involved in cell wall biosynthesis
LWRWFALSDFQELTLRILLLSFYYKPDLCAGSFRATAMVEALLNNMGPDDHLEVITTLPNRYVTYSDAASANLSELEQHPRLTIHRISLPSHKSGMLDQSKSFLVFAQQAVKLSRQQNYQLIVATSSRLMTACLAAWIARCQATPLYLDIRDIFVDTMQDVLSPSVSRWLSPFLSWVEKKTVLQANKVNLVSAGFLAYFQQRYPQQTYACFTNGIDEEFLAINKQENAPDLDSSVDLSVCEVLYAGNIGEGQGLHHILPGLANALKGQVRFKVVGDGGRSKQLKIAIEQLGIENVDLLPPMNRANLIQAYSKADVLFLHLNNYAAFEKVLPSKIFEYAALGKPILAGVAGYPRQFIAQEVTNAEFFEPCDVEDAVKAFSRLEICDSPRQAFVEKYRRSNIMDLMAKDILSVVSTVSRT